MPRSDTNLYSRSGFPCRFERCAACFHVADGSRMDALLAASDERARHELLVHGLIIAAHVPEDRQKAWISRTHARRDHPH